MAHYEEDLIDELETDEAEGMSEAYDELDSRPSATTNNRRALPTAAKL